MDEKVLIRGYTGLLSEIYRPRRYFERCMRLLLRMPVRKNREQALSWIRIRALLRSIRVQGLSFYSASYFRFLFHTLLVRPRAFAVAAAMAIKGHHFFTITDQILAAETLRDTLALETRSLVKRLNDVVESGRGTTSLRRSILRARGKIRRRYLRLTEDARLLLADAYRQFQLLTGNCLLAVSA
jgi:hypothetical protein